MTAPHMTVPRTPRRWAMRDASPPHAEARLEPPRSMTTTSPSCIVCSTCSSGLPTPPPKRYAAGSCSSAAAAPAAHGRRPAPGRCAALRCRGARRRTAELVERVGHDRRRVLRQLRNTGSSGLHGTPDASFVRSRRRAAHHFAPSPTISPNVSVPDATSSSFAIACARHRFERRAPVAARRWRRSRSAR